MCLVATQTCGNLNQQEFLKITVAQKESLALHLDHKLTTDTQIPSSVLPLIGPLPGAVVRVAGTRSIRGNLLVAGLHELTTVALIDTGAQVNLVDATLATLLSSESWNGPRISVRGVNGIQPPPAITILLVAFEGSELAQPVPCLVMPNLPRPLLLGQAFLFTLGVIVDFQQSTLKINGQVAPLVTSISANPKTNYVKNQLRTSSTTFQVPQSWKYCRAPNRILLMVMEAETNVLREPEKNYSSDPPDPGWKTLPTATPAKRPTQTEAAAILDAFPMEHLTPTERTRVRAVLYEFADLWWGEPRGTLQFGSHSITVTTTLPIREPRRRRFTAEERRSMQTELDKMLEANVVRPSSSPHVAEVVMIRKKTGEWRFCIDYRPLNRMTVLDAHPLPAIIELLRRVGDSQYFVALDLRSGYWQIPLAPNSIPFTAFRCNDRLYEFTVMPFGLVNAPATFQRMMEALFGEIRNGGVLVYLDDILIHTKTFSQNLHLLITVLTRLRLAGLTVNLKKCEFYPREILYLGHIIGNGKRRPNPKGVATLRAWKRPEDIGELRSLVGKCSYLRDYVPNFAKTMAPVTELLRGLSQKARKAKSTEPIQWNVQCSQAINTLVEQVANSSLVIPANYAENNRLVLQTDASGVGFGAVLNIGVSEGNQQRLHPIEFYAAKFTDVMKKWPTQEREAYAIVHSLDHWADFCRGREVDVHTDNANLRFLLRASKGKLANWATMLAPYSLRIFHKAGKELKHVDYWSRYALVDELIPDAASFDSVWAGRTKANFTTNKDEQEQTTVTCAATCSEETASRPRKRVRKTTQPNDEKVTQEDTRLQILEDGLTSEVPIPLLQGTVSSLSDRQFCYHSYALLPQQDFCTNAASCLPSLRAEVNNNASRLEKFRKLTKKYCSNTATPLSTDQIINCQKEWRAPLYGRGFSVNPSGATEYNGGLWVPPPLRVAIIQMIHERTKITHIGYKACFRALRPTLNWRDIRPDISAYIKSCIFCQQTSPSQKDTHRRRQPLDPDTLFSRIHVDIWSTSWPTPASPEQHISCLTIIDSFSKFIEVLPIQDQKGETILGAFIFGWASRYGWPRILVTDNAANLASGIFAKTLSAQGVRFCHSAPYHPQGNALIERVHRDLNHHLRVARLNEPPPPFSTALGLTLFTMRTVTHSTVGLTPAYVTFGIDLRPPQETPFLPLAGRYVTTQQEIIRFFHELRIYTWERMRQAAEQQRAMSKKEEIPIHAGSLALLPESWAPPKIRSKTACLWSRVVRVIQIHHKRDSGPRVLLVRCLQDGRYFEVLECQARCVGPPLCYSQEVPLERFQRQGHTKPTTTPYNLESHIQDGLTTDREDKTQTSK